MIQPLLLPQTPAMAPVPGAALILDQANFVAFMMEAEPAARGSLADPQPPSDPASQTRDAGSDDSIPALSSRDAYDPPPAQDASMGLESGAAKDALTPALEALFYAASTLPAPQDSARTLPKTNELANPKQAFSFAAMAFADLSTAAQPGLAGPTLKLSTKDPLPVHAAEGFGKAVLVRNDVFVSRSVFEAPAFSEFATVPQGPGQQIAFPDSGVPDTEAAASQTTKPNSAATMADERAELVAKVKGQKLPENEVQQVSLSAVQTLSSEPQIGFTEPVSSRAETPSDGSPKKENVPKLAETSVSSFPTKTQQVATESRPSPGLPEREVSQSSLTSVQIWASKPEGEFSEPVHLGAELPLHGGPSQVRNVSDIAETQHFFFPAAMQQTMTEARPSPLADRVSFAPIDRDGLTMAGEVASDALSRYPNPQAFPAFAPSPAQTETQSAVSPSISSVSSYNRAEGRSDPLPALHSDPVPARPSSQPSSFRHTVLAGLLPADTQIPSAGATDPDYNAVSLPHAQNARPSDTDAGKCFAEVSADRPYFVTNISEIRVYPAGADPDSSAVTGMVSEGGPRPADDEPTLTRLDAAARPLTTEILRLVQTSPDGPVTLTLRPEELGTLRFEVKQTEQGLHIHLSVEQPQTLDLLRRQGDQLLADLRQAGFAGASLSFAGGGAQDAPTQQRDQPQDARFSPTPIPAHDRPSPQLRPMGLSGALDLRL